MNIEEDDESIPGIPTPSLSNIGKKSSAINLDIDTSLHPEQADEYKNIQQILIRMNKLCTQGSSKLLNIKQHEQRLLRNVGVHTVVLDFLQIPYDEKEDVRMNKLMRLAHEFLQNFCLGNQQNQVLLYKHLDLFLNSGIQEAQTVCSILQDNFTLCNEVNEKVIQHFVHCIEYHGRHVQYLKVLQTILKAENQFIRKSQDMVMQELINAGEDVLVFYNDKASFNHFIDMMRSERHSMNEGSPLRYHVELVKLLACCTMGKNVYTEIKCHSLLPLDDIVAIVTHSDCIPEVKEAYVKFLNHCYIDTEVEMKEIYTSNHMWSLFEKSFLVDMADIATSLLDSKSPDKALEHYVTNGVMNIISTFFSGPFSDQSITLQTRQPIFIQLLQTSFQVSQCSSLTPLQRFNVENCICTLSDVAKNCGIAIPLDLNNQVNAMYNKAKFLTRHTNKWLKASKTPKMERSQSQLMHLDRSIIESLQDIVSLLEDQLKPLMQSELSLLVDVLYRPELLFSPETESRRKCESGELIRRLIKHTKQLVAEKEDKLCVKVLRIFREMMAIDSHYGEKGDAFRNSLLAHYFGKSFPQKPELKRIHLFHEMHGPGTKLLCRAGPTLHEVQNHLNKEGASDLLVEMIINSVHSSSIFSEAVHFGITLLEGGNLIIQKSIFSKLVGGQLSQPCFKVFYDKMQEAQQEIKSTVIVNTNGMSAKAHEDKQDDNNIDKTTRKSETNGNKISDEVQKKLKRTAESTSQVYLKIKSASVDEDSCLLYKRATSAIEDILAEKLENHRERSEQNSLSPKILIMQPILRFLQLLCENHNQSLQNLLRNQNNKTNFNLVSESLMFLDCICGSTTGGLGLLGLYINENNVSLINQTLKTLTEYCQGPCHENQNCIATHESNGLDIITALILNDINPLGKTRMDLVLELKNNASKLLLAIMESRCDSENAERILYNINPKQLVDVACGAYHQKLTNKKYIDNDNTTFDDNVSPRKVGKNIYILCHQLARHNKKLASLLQSADGTDPKTHQALLYYASHTAQIEIVRHDRTLEQIVFPIPEICAYITKDTKYKVLNTAEKDDQGSKVTDFFERTDEMYNEMKWQKKLKAQPILFWVSSYMSLWSNILFTCAVLINLIVAFYYPFDDTVAIELGSTISALIWIAMMAGVVIVLTVSKETGIQTLMASTILRLIISLGPEPTWELLGTLTLVFKGIHVVSIIGNHGTITKTYHQILTDAELLYHLTYLIFCLLGTLIHPFFYSFLLFDVVYREETLINVIRSVTKNGRSIILTAVLAIILIYMFSIIGYMFFKDDFLVNVDEDIVEAPIDIGCTTIFDTLGLKYRNNLDQDSQCTCQKPFIPAAVVGNDVKERACDSLIMCIVTTLNQGLRNGGGIGDILRAPSSSESLFVARVVYDLLFFFIVIFIILNLISGVIIDTFADLRSEKQQKELVLKDTCFICGLNRTAFDNKTVNFEEHIKCEHNMSHYLYFIVLMKVKDPTEFTGPESYVYTMMKTCNLDWFPRLRAMSLSAVEGDAEQMESRGLQLQLETTQALVSNLSLELLELKEQISELRKQRIGLLNSPSSYLYTSTIP